MQIACDNCGKTIERTKKPAFCPACGHKLEVGHWTIECNGGYQQQSATVSARRRVALDEPARETFEAIAESLSGSFPHNSLHRKVIRWWMKGELLFVEVRIETDFYPSAYVSSDWATKDAREILARFDAALEESNSGGGPTAE